jgi:hypothetical protein
LKNLSFSDSTKVDEFFDHAGIHSQRNYGKIMDGKGYQERALKR